MWPPLFSDTVDLGDTGITGNPPMHAFLTRRIQLKWGVARLQVLTSNSSFEKEISQPYTLSQTTPTMAIGTTKVFAGIPFY